MEFKLKDGMESEAVEYVKECAGIASDRSLEPILRFLALVNAAATVAHLENDAEYANFLHGRAFALQAFIEKSNPCQTTENA